MDFDFKVPELPASGKRRKKLRIGGDDGYPSGLHMYLTPPKEIISLQDFEDLAVERLKVLRVIERINVSGKAKMSEEWSQAIRNDLKNQKLGHYIPRRSEDDHTDENKRKDYISHFILRLAFCRTEELKKWFISHEVSFMRFRFMDLQKDEIKEFLIENKLNYNPISNEEKQELRDKLISCIFGLQSAQIDKKDYYKVHFTDVLDLVKSRRVYLKQGFAYIPSTDLISLVISVYRTHLSFSMTLTARLMPTLQDDERLNGLLRDFDKRYTGQDYSNRKLDSGDQVYPEELDQLSTQAFPLCMRQLHEALRSNHHLRHGGRMQYGLFLKGIGVTLEDSLRFWRDEISKYKDGDYFDKNYAYNVRHNYGKEGKRANYTPFSCMKVILSAPGAGDHHGCPFKHTDTNQLRQKLLSYRVKSKDIHDVVDLASKGHYQIACQRYFEVTHGTELASGINHPNQYFVESKKVTNGEQKLKEEKGIRKSENKYAVSAAIVAKKEKVTQPDNDWGEDFDMTGITE